LQLNWGVFAQMVVCLVVTAVPGTRYTVISNFFVSGVALLITGVVQTYRNEIAFYQQSLVLFMSGLGFGPAAVAWVRWGGREVEGMFSLFSILYVLAMVAYGGWILHIGFKPRPEGELYYCYQVQVTKFYGGTSLRTIDIAVVVVCASIIALSALGHYCVGPRTRTSVFRWSFAGITFIVVLALEIALAALVYETSKAYGKLVPENLRVELEAWTFGQIVPFTILIYPVMEFLRSGCQSKRIARDEENS
jgi:hypothetical protein